MLAKSTLSVVMPTFNCAQMMGRHLKSMSLWADLADEIIVVDSRSTDGTLEFIRERLRHPNLRIIERDRGLYESWNEGIAATTGDWVYISTAGDTINRNHLLHLIELGIRAATDVVISPPHFVDEAGNPLPELRWPPQEIIRDYGTGKPFALSQAAITYLALLNCPNCLLGSSASNIYRGDTLRNRPFPTDFRGGGDTVWMMRHALSVRICLTPQRGSSFCVHPKDEQLSRSQAEAHIQKFFDEKAILVTKMGEPSAGENITILTAMVEEAKLYAHTRQLHQNRRHIWHALNSNPLAIFTWINLTIVYGWNRTKLSQKRRFIQSELHAKNFANNRHFQPIN